jgi:hypothetical protein
MGKNRRELLEAEPEMLEVKLNPAEVLQRGEMLAATLGELEALDAEEREFKERLKKARAPLQSDVTQLSKVVRRKAELRPVLVETTADFERGLAVSFRVDTGEVIRERDLTAEERQGKLISIPRPRRTLESEEAHP